jgi:dGTP triphosphohydrolase
MAILINKLMKNKDTQLLEEAYDTILNKLFSFGKPDPTVLKYVEELERIEREGDFGRIEAAEFFYEKVPSALWKDVLKHFKKRNEDSVVADYIEHKIGSKTK